MAAKFTQKIRSYTVGCLIDGTITEDTQQWQALTSYTKGVKRFYGNNKYVASQTGTSGTIPPEHLTGGASDGGIEWIWVEAINPNEVFKKNLFYFIGKKTAWDDENTPDDVVIGDDEDYTTINNIITLKKVTSDNFRFAAKRYDWTPGTVYDSYDPKKDPLAVWDVGNPDNAYENPFYVLTDQNHIFKCIDNNNGASSTIKPNDTGVSNFLLSDGYVWKYIGTIDADSVYFLTADYIPVEFKRVDDGSAHWITQQSAKKKSISGFKIKHSIGTFETVSSVSLINGGSPTEPMDAYITKNGDHSLKQVLISNPGSGYNYSETLYGKVYKNGKPGSGATVGAITVVEGVVTGIELDEPGQDYEDAVCVIVDEGTEPMTHAVVSVTININGEVSNLTITNGGTGYSDSANLKGYIIPGDAGAIVEAIMAPKEGHGANLINDLSANTAIIRVRLSEPDTYFLGGEENAFRQIGLITDIKDKETGEYGLNTRYIGPSHPQYNNNAYTRMDDTAGFILYLNNIKPVIKSEGQEEDLRVAINF